MRTHLCKSYFSCQNQLNGGRAKYTSLIDVSILNETGRIERKKMNLGFFWKWYEIPRFAFTKFVFKFFKLTVKQAINPNG